MAIIGVCYEPALHNIVYTALYNCVYNILHTKITIYNVSDNEIHDVMNYTGTKVPGFWEQPTRNIRDISNAVVVSLFTKASP